MEKKGCDCGEKKPQAEQKQPVETSPEGKLIENSGYKFACCPNCSTKYKLDTDENGKTKIKGLDDVDDIEPGTQIYCLKCGKKFTLPQS